MTRRDHYSYSHYADSGVAEGFDALRFGGPIGRVLLESQQALLRRAVLRPDVTIADVGTGTGRAAIGLAADGARAVGVDASLEMLRVAAARAAAGGVTLRIVRADAHALPLASRSVDAAVSLRVLMHALDWRQCVAELCRIARWRVVVDFPSRTSLAALESAVRRLRLAAGGRVEAYRVIGIGDIRREFARHGFRLVDVHRQFVLPIALHKAIGRVAVTRRLEALLGGLGFRRLLGSPITVVAESQSADARREPQ
jgi:SAM-dependent methyltransferase